MNKVATLTLFAASLSACAGSDEFRASQERNPAPCPNIVVLNDAARLVDFATDEKTIENVAWSAEIEDVSIGCRYYSDKPIEASVEVDLAFGRGPAADGIEREYQYFVAVTRTDSEVIAKETFTVPVKFDPDKNVYRLEDEIDEIVIPRKGEETSGLNFEIVVGLVVTADQLRFNRSGESLKFPEL
ncbi:MAG: hypothetical protein AAFR21_00850 [Pseudomonadota bacterium]